MNQKLLECVPNFSEGRDTKIIEKIVNEVNTTKGVTLLNVDPGKATNRTVVTFVGDPKSVIEAAFKLIKKSGELIDMEKHSGEHPRMGATDVCPLIPVSNITMEETVEYSKKLAEKVGNELNIPVYLYENSASKKYRRNLSDIREGEYEGLKNKLKNNKWQPDFGSQVFEHIKKFGATAIGARDFLIAYNINLNTTSTRRANAIAFDIREKGRIARKGGKLTGPILKDKNGNTIWKKGSLKHVKAIGWFIEEYGVAQISMNLTNISKTPIHIVFDEVCKKAEKRGIRVTGSELVGLIPLKSMIDAGKYFLKKQKRSCGISDAEIIKIAQKTMGLDEIETFNPNERIIEYQIKNQAKKLTQLSLTDFLQETASESPAPGGGSISAYIGALGASLATMVANLSSHKRGWDDKWEEFSILAENGQKYIIQLEKLVDEDTNAFNNIINAFRLADTTEKEKEHKNAEIQKATLYAIEIPLKIMEKSLKSMDLIETLVQSGNPNSVSDAGVAAACARSAVLGGYLNVMINIKDYDNETDKINIIKKAEKIKEKAIKKEDQILKKTMKIIQKPI
ncbi:MAG: glutamate formimidoyltransferase [Flavobacteriales bacterium]|nr:glutamate formimidoyltransferase [Flavobacteriales bacterium]|tara:strand:+ start:1262 stop:2962 length:1701 start_codon:yes stop_codon:yes gene_type:complete